MSEHRIDGQGSTAGNVRGRQESTRGTTKSRNQDMLRDIVVVPPTSICGRFGLRAARMQNGKWDWNSVRSSWIERSRRVEDMPE
jgi:hypothetical protein